MDELPIHASVGHLSTWEDEQVRRAYVLTVRQVRALLGCDVAGSDELRSAEEEAAMFGEELLRRRLL